MPTESSWITLFGATIALILAFGASVPATPIVAGPGAPTLTETPIPIADLKAGVDAGGLAGADVDASVGGSDGAKVSAGAVGSVGRTGDADVNAGARANVGSAKAGAGTDVGTSTRAGGSNADARANADVDTGGIAGTDNKTSGGAKVGAGVNADAGAGAAGANVDADVNAGTNAEVGGAKVGAGANAGAGVGAAGTNVDADVNAGTNAEVGGAKVGAGVNADAGAGAAGARVDADVNAGTNAGVGGAKVGAGVNADAGASAAGTQVDADVDADTNAGVGGAKVGAGVNAGAGAGGTNVDADVNAGANAAAGGASVGAASPSETSGNGTIGAHATLAVPALVQTSSSILLPLLPPVRRGDAADATRIRDTQLAMLGCVDPLADGHCPTEFDTKAGAIPQPSIHFEIVNVADGAANAATSTVVQPTQGARPPYPNPRISQSFGISLADPIRTKNGLLVRCIIVNTSSRNQPIPRLDVRLLDSAGEVVGHSMLSAPSDALAGGQDKTFKLRIRPLPPHATRLAVLLVSPR